MAKTIDEITGKIYPLFIFYIPHIRIKVMQQFQMADLKLLAATYYFQSIFQMI